MLFMNVGSSLPRRSTAESRGWFDAVRRLGRLEVAIFLRTFPTAAEAYPWIDEECV